MTNKSDKILAPIKSRVLQFIENQHFEKKTFFEKLNVASSNFRGNALYSEISADVIAKILALYPNANSEWLLTGNGSMLKNENKNSLSQNITGDGNTQAGYGIAITGDNKDLVKELKKQLIEKDKEIERQKKQIDKLFNMIP
ncbi:hypothetical protein [Chryseobacterium scophthalmum]|uniref:hypothetical protein n=1 Tax=Chryseobacterium scophthalmum TaxID=59733 RepID=UPI000C9E68A8|nr:hypothetical protein [Chryseobacterium scophthalmum]